MMYLASIFRQNLVLRTVHCRGIGAFSPWFLSQRNTCCTPSPPTCPKGKLQMLIKPYVQPCYKDHDHKNMTLRRPMSPHVTMYKMTITAATSILQRITGVMLTGYALLLTGGTLFLPNGIETYVTMIQSLDLSQSSAFCIKMIAGAPFAFHYFNGIRFCMWNAGRWLAMTDVKNSAYRSWVASVVLALIFALL